MPKTYRIDFENFTPDTLLFAIHADFADNPGLEERVSFLQATVPPEGGMAGVEFEESYSVMVIDYFNLKGIGIYKAFQSIPAAIGTAWSLIFKDNVSQFKRNSIGKASSDTITILNRSKTKATLGIGIGGRPAAYKKNVYVDAKAAFKISHGYYLQVHRVDGMVKYDVQTDPVKLEFAGGLNIAKVAAKLVNSSKIVISVEYDYFENARDDSKL
ncbi:10242_t:CDS:2 [Ambispora gerdemannii]|uniref:10242_t:CDS:1 n=1 Tax=Ambispora gerdemannii TaxID=144530 RepID=A0A9N8ZEM8_9GLOM|nr:10242_t:CDS:2 [Ambispora gerdemannii]